VLLSSFTVSQLGFVGINNPNPQYTLDVVGSNRFVHFTTATQTANATLVVANATATPFRAISFYTNLNAGGYGGLTAAGDMGIIFTDGTIDTGNLVIAPWHNGTKGIKILSTGNVGIGTGNPDNTLTVKGVIQLNDVTTNQKYGMYSDGSIFQLNPRNASGGYSNIQGLAMVSTGNVGIGTATPGETLDINGVLNLRAGTVQGYPTADNSNKTNTYIAFADAGASTDWAFLRQIGGNNTIHISLDFHDDNLDGLFSIRGVNSSINPDGQSKTFFHVNGQQERVGINTSTPLYGLDVRGTAQIEWGGRARFGTIQPSEGFAMTWNTIQAGTSNGMSEFISGRGGGPNGGFDFFVNVANDTNATASDLAVRITGDKKVGINTASPGTTLDVRGNFNISQFASLTNTNDPTVTIGNAPGSRDIRIYTNLNGNAYNTSVQNNDSAIIFSGGSVGTATGLVIGPWANSTGGLRINASGNVAIAGTLSKGGGSFEIDHPILKNSTLVHSFIEGPRCDLIYRGKKQLSSGIAVINLEKESTGNGSTMTPGTFVALCTNPQTYLQNNETFDRIIGSVSANILIIRSENTDSTATIDWMVIAERHDPFIKKWDRTDSNGLLILEHGKQ
jgi:hypothetical protein